MRAPAKRLLAAMRSIHGGLTPETLSHGSVVLRPGVALISDLMPTTQIAVEKATTSQDNASIVSIMVVSLLLLYMKILYPEAVHPRGPAEKEAPYYDQQVPSSLLE